MGSLEKGINNEPYKIKTAPSLNKTAEINSFYGPKNSPTVGQNFSEEEISIEKRFQQEQYNESLNKLIKKLGSFLNKINNDPQYADQKWTIFTSVSVKFNVTSPTLPNNANFQPPIEDILKVVEKKYIKGYSSDIYELDYYIDKLIKDYGYDTSSPNLYEENYEFQTKKINPSEPAVSNVLSKTQALHNFSNINNKRNTYPVGTTNNIEQDDTTVLSGNGNNELDGDDIIIEDNESIKISMEEMKDSIFRIIQEENVDINNSDLLFEFYTSLSSIIEVRSSDQVKMEALLYATIIGIDINTYQDLDEFIDTVKGEEAGETTATKYTQAYKNFINKMKHIRDGYIRESAIKSLTERYQMANKLAENKKFYDTDFISFEKSNANSEDASGLQVASKIKNVNDELDHYKFESQKSEHENAVLKYTAFEVAFNNEFNLNDPLIQRIAELGVDLRSELSIYNFYDSELNFFNQKSWDKFVSEKLEIVGLTADEISSLQGKFEQLPDLVNNNYEILSGNFDTDRNNFEKITKIYALGEIIDNIKKLFSDINNEKLGNYMGLQLDAKEPASIRHNCLFIKGKVNGTETHIRYDLSTGKLYINSFTQESINPPMIKVGNTEPKTEIGDLGSFEGILQKYNPTCFICQSDEHEQHKEDENVESSEYGNNKSNSTDTENLPENNEENKNSIEYLYKNKLMQDLKTIGEIVQEKAGEQSKENNAIEDFLKTFNILPDNGEIKNVEFVGGSSLFTVLQSIKNTNKKSELVEFSRLMQELMSYCCLTRGKNNGYSKDPDFTSITIFDIDKNNASEDIISLQEANEKFFIKGTGENEKIKNCESHFDPTVKLSFANIIAQKCCKNTGNGTEISIIDMQNFVTSIKDGLDTSDCQTRLAAAYSD